MKLIRNLLYFLLAVAMLALGAMFAVQNEATVPLDLLVVALPERSVALWVLLAFAAGGVLGMLTSLGVILKLRTGLMAANRKLAKQVMAAGSATPATGEAQPSPVDTQAVPEQKNPAAAAAEENKPQ